ncbi:MAG: hydroxysqualene dehydroxylase HpnE [Pseudomonadota bacterium]
MTSPKVHIVGAGLSGLAAATRLASQGHAVTVYESAGHAGGRCRSFFDKTLDCMIDNGNHLIMSGNKAALNYLDLIGSEDSLIGPDWAQYPFVDVKSGVRWVVRLNEGFIPFWIFDPKWRVPGSKVMDYVKAGSIVFAGDDKTVDDVVDPENILYKNFWEPLTLAVLNTTPAEGQAKLLWSVIRETFLLGGQASRPLVAREGLGPAFVDPAVDYLKAKGAEVLFNARVRELEIAEGRVSALHFPEEKIVIDEGDQVVFAIPPSRLKTLFPELDPPDDSASILNVHYRIDREVPMDKLMGAPFIGMVSSDAQWAFVRDDVVSLTVSASHVIGMDDVPNREAADTMWRETQMALGLESIPYKAVRVIRERRATPDQSPAAAAKRLQPETQWSNVILAGDHTDTGVPATIEGSIRSGNRAADIAIRQRTS